MAKYGGGEVSIDGIDELIKDLGKFGEAAKPYIIDAANKAGEIVKSKAIQKAPSNTGKLKASIKLTKAKKGKAENMNINSKVGVGDAKYGIPLELGHKMVLFGRKTGLKVAERPFLRPAADESKEEVLSIVTSAMNKALEELGEK